MLEHLIYFWPLCRIQAVVVHAPSDGYSAVHQVRAGHQPVGYLLLKGETHLAEPGGVNHVV